MFIDNYENVIYEFFSCQGDVSYKLILGYFKIQHWFFFDYQISYIGDGFHFVFNPSPQIYLTKFLKIKSLGKNQQWIVVSPQLKNTQNLVFFFFFFFFLK